MTRRHRRATTALILAIAMASALAAAPVSGPSAQASVSAAIPMAPGPNSRWLAIGDSISSGFGIPELSPAKTPWGQDCRRADGVGVEIPSDTDALAGPSWRFVPCVSRARLAH